MKEKIKNYFSDPKLKKRIVMSLCGVIICAVSVGIFKEAALGVDPFQSFMAGLDALVPDTVNVGSISLNLGFGTLYTIVNIILLLFSIIVDRHNIGIATFINLFLLGYITEYSYKFFQSLMPAPSMVVRAICLIVGIVIICFGSALYMTADLGVSTYDAIAIVMSGKWKIGPFKFVRIGTDLVCVILGTVLFLLSGGSWKAVPTIVGIGTIVTAFFMGPLVDLFNRKVAIPWLNKGSDKK